MPEQTGKAGKFTSSQLNPLLIQLRAERIFDGTRFCPPETVVTLDDETGSIISLQEETEHADIQVLPGIICPGWVNAHCHTELSHMRGLIPERTGLPGFVGQVMQQRQASSEVIDDAIRTAMDEMYRSGIVAVGDISNGTSSIASKLSTPLTFCNFIEVTGFVPGNAEKRFEAGADVLNAFQAAGLANSQLVPHAPYSVSKPLLNLINAASAGRPVSIHNQECADENAFFESGSGGFVQLFRSMGIDLNFFHPSGKSSLQSILPDLNRPSRLLLVHNSFTTKEDLIWLKNWLNQTGSIRPDSVHFCLCPGANQYIEGVLPPANWLEEGNFPVCIGTDSLASNWQLDIIEELNLLRTGYPKIPLASLLKWATRGGAEALELDSVCGSFAPGFKPGVLHLSEDPLTGKLQLIKRLC